MTVFVWLFVCLCVRKAHCVRRRVREIDFLFFFFFSFFNPSKAAWPFLLYCRRTKRCGVEMSAEWADREKADGVRYWWKKGAARPRPILQLGPLFCLSVFLLLLLRKKTRLEPSKKKNILHKGKRNRGEGFSSIYAVRKLSSAAVNKGEGCWGYTVCTEENRIQCTCTIQGREGY